MNKSMIFISYSHNDREYFERLLIHLKPLEKEGLIYVWADTKLKAGDQWRTEIEHALDRASIAILLVSADFLASDFITENELPPLLHKAQEQGTRIIPVILKPCRYIRDKNLNQFQSFNNPDETVVRMTYGKQENLYDAIAAEVEKYCSGVKATRRKTLTAYGGEVVVIDGHGYLISEDGLTKTLLPDIQTAQFFASSKGIIEINDNQEQTEIRALATEPEKIESVMQGRLVIIRDAGHVFIILNGKRYYVPSWDILINWGRTSPDKVDEAEVHSIPSGRLSIRA